MKSKLLGCIFVAVILFFAYLLFYPSPIQPVSWQAPSAPQAVGIYAPNTALASAQLYSLPENSKGPESIDFNAEGTGATADSDGMVYTIKGKNGQYQFTPWVKLNSRPLGVEFDQLGRLVIADAVAGLLRITAAGKVEVLSDQYQGRRYGFVDDVAIARNGDIYFSDATDRQWLQENPALAMHASQFEILEHAGNGRLYVYHAEQQSVELLLEGLQFANGVALSANEDFVLVNETGSYQVRRYWLKGSKAGTSDLFASNLPGFPDNITSASDGGFWLALIKPRSALLDRWSDRPLLRKISSRIPLWMLPIEPGFNQVIKLNAQGKVVLSLQDPGATIENVTSAIEQRGQLFLGNLSDAKIGVIKIPEY